MMDKSHQATRPLLLLGLALALLPVGAGAAGAASITTLDVHHDYLLQFPLATQYTGAEQTSWDINASDPYMMIPSILLQGSQGVNYTLTLSDGNSYQGWALITPGLTDPITHSGQYILTYSLDSTTLQVNTIISLGSPQVSLRLFYAYHWADQIGDLYVDNDRKMPWPPTSQLIGMSLGQSSTTTTNLQSGTTMQLITLPYQSTDGLTVTRFQAQSSGNYPITFNGWQDTAQELTNEHTPDQQGLFHLNPASYTGGAGSVSNPLGNNNPLNTVRDWLSTLISFFVGLLLIPLEIFALVKFLLIDNGLLLVSLYEVLIGLKCVTNPRNKDFIDVILDYLTTNVQMIQMVLTLTQMLITYTSAAILAISQAASAIGAAAGTAGSLIEDAITAAILLAKK